MDQLPVSKPLHPKVVLTCPPSGSSHLATEIRQRGNIPLELGHHVLLELKPRDISQNWAETAKLPAQRIAALSWHLAQDIADDDEPENHGSEAAALFLLALRHHHASLDRALSGCRITWNDNATTEKVEYLI
jgi:hypothetical protein